MRAGRSALTGSEVAGEGALAEAGALGLHGAHGHGLAVLARRAAIAQAAPQQAPAVHQVQRKRPEHQPCMARSCGWPKICL